jgi:hypothetical protein
LEYKTLDGILFETATALNAANLLTRRLIRLRDNKLINRVDFLYSMKQTRPYVGQG